LADGAVDWCSWRFLLFLTGGLHNPFSLLFVGACDPIFCHGG